MFYILLCMKQECCGMDIMDRVPAMTAGRVQVGSGTLYNLLDQFLDAGMIKETRAEGRRRSYELTDKGQQMFAAECDRLRRCIADAESASKEESLC
jgi:DNA-binding PadR family transcriptional regulator